MFGKSYGDEAATERAACEWERIELEQKREIYRKIKELHDKFGDTIPKEQIDPVKKKRVAILYSLSGHSQGMRDRGLIPDEEAASAADKLNAMRKGKLEATLTRIEQRSTESEIIPGSESNMHWMAEKHERS